MNTSPTDPKSDGRASAPVRLVLTSEDMIAMIHHNLASIRAEIAAGAKVDPNIVEELEARLARYEQQHSTANGRSR